MMMMLLSVLVLMVLSFEPIWLLTKMVLLMTYRFPQSLSFEPFQVLSFEKMLKALSFEKMLKIWS
jgi:hypothetical protein